MGHREPSSRLSTLQQRPERGLNIESEPIVVTVSLWCQQCDTHTDHDYEQLEKREPGERREYRQIVCAQCGRAGYALSLIHI